MKLKGFDFTDLDCGRGFVRIEDVCLNVSYASTTKDQIAEKCSEINATPLVTKSNALYFQMKVSLLFINYQSI